MRKHGLGLIKPPFLCACLSCVPKKVLLAMEADSDIKYVGLHTGSTVGYHKKISSRYRINLQRRVVAGVTLIPMIQWYDSTHICTVEHYKNFVFGRQRLTKGNFIEADLGQKQLQTITTEGMQAHAEYATFLLDDDPMLRIVAHMDGASKGAKHTPLALNPQWYHCASLCNRKPAPLCHDNSY